MDISPDPCLYCDVVAGRTEASLVFQDDVAIVVMEGNPVNPGHALVIARGHASGLEDLDEEVGAHMWCLAHRVARGLRRSGLRCEGVNIFLGDGEVALQEVLHAHLHVFPRFEGDNVVVDADCEPRGQRLLNQEAWALREAMKPFIPAPSAVMLPHGAPAP
ncbi:HIT family protein [Sphaerisporangium perillae]|uniref:HIT family protein n=1 Tax=Sphaerisporangium perillae TaxID=2935860 RepID=UPI00200EB975|nr:HIT family protein [Sphaerisporangium perillae]